MRIESHEYPTKYTDILLSHAELAVEQKKRELWLM